MEALTLLNVTLAAVTVAEAGLQLSLAVRYMMTIGQLFQEGVDTVEGALLNYVERGV